MTRLETISSYINNGELVLDVGCDKAHLSRILAKRKIYSVASDIHPHIIEEAISLTSPELIKYITFKAGDGVTIDDEKNYTLVLAGMGTHTILKILDNSKKEFKKVITISNNNHDILRTKMLKYGYKVDCEEIIKEKKKYYNLIVFIKGKKDYSKEEILYGYNHKNKILLKERNDYLINKYTKILEHTNNKNLVEKVEILKNFKY